MSALPPAVLAGPRRAASLTLSDTIAAWLREHAVATAFTLPGSSCLLLIEAMYHAQAEVVLGRDEGSAVHAANAASACTGTFGCAILSRGPGALSGVCGLVTACDGDPVLLICGDNARALRGRSVVTQDAPLADIFAAAAPTFVVTDAESCTAALERLELVLVGKRRSAVLILPSDVLSLPAVPRRMAQGAPLVQAVGPDDIAPLIDRVHAARRPFLIWGERVIRDPGLRALAERALAASPRLDSAVTMRGLSRIPAGTRGIVGTQGHPEINALLARSDLVVIVGERLSAVSTGAPDCFVVDVPVWSLSLPGDTQDYIAPTCEVMTTRDGMDTFLRRLPDNATGAETADWQPPEPDAPAPLLELLRSLPAKITVTLDSGQNFFWAAHALAATPARPAIYSERQGTMGFAIPAAIGAACVTGEPVLAIVGDGGLLMRLGELHTIASLYLPVTILVIDNHGLGMVRRTQANRGLADIATALPQWRMLAVARALGFEVADLSPTTCRSFSEQAPWRPTLLRLAIPATRALISRGGPTAPLPGTVGSAV